MDDELRGLGTVITVILVVLAELDWEGFEASKNDLNWVNRGWDWEGWGKGWDWD